MHFFEFNGLKEIFESVFIEQFFSLSNDGFLKSNEKLYVGRIHIHVVDTMIKFINEWFMHTK